LNTEKQTKKLCWKSKW